MRSTFTKVTAFILSGALILSGNDVISFAKSGQNLSSAVAAVNENTEESADEPSGTGDGSKEGEEKPGTGETGGTTPGESGTDGTDMEESTSSEAEVTTPEESDTVMTTTEEPKTEVTTPEESETEEASTSNPGEEADARIIDVELLDVDENSAVFQDSDGTYITKKSKIKAKIQIEAGSDKNIELEFGSGDDGSEDEGNNGPEGGSGDGSGDDNDGDNKPEGGSGDGSGDNNDVDNKPESGSSDGSGDDNDGNNKPEGGSSDENVSRNNDVGDSENKDGSDSGDNGEGDSGNSDVGDNGGDIKEYERIVELSEGKNEITITVKSDDKIADAKTLIIICDTKKPVLNIEDKGNYKIGDSIKFKPEDTGSGIKEFGMKIGDKEVELTKDGDGKYVFTFDESFKEPEKKQEKLDVCISAKDKAGNDEEEKLTICFDFTGPKVTRDVWCGEETNKLTPVKENVENTEGTEDTKETKDVYYINEKRAIDIKIEAEDIIGDGYASGMAKLTIEEIKDGLHKECEHDNEKDGKCSVELTYNPREGQDYERKSYVITAEDNDGNITTEKFDIVYDCMAPELSANVYYKDNSGAENKVTAEVENDEQIYYVGTNSVIKLAVVEKHSGIKDVTVKYKSKNESDSNYVTIMNSNDNNNDGEYCCQIASEAGEYIYNCSATDKAGNSYDVDVIVVVVKAEIEVKYYRDEKKEIQLDAKDCVYGAQIWADVCIKDKFSILEEKIVVSGGVIEGNPSIENGYYNVTYKITEEGNHDFSIIYTNKVWSTTEHTTKIVIDNTVPVINVKFGTEGVENTKYFKKRTVEITITEENFDSGFVKFECLGGTELPKITKDWEKVKEDTHTVTVDFTEDGIYNFKVICEDKAGNKKETNQLGEFVIDTVVPKVDIKFEDEADPNKKYYNEFRTLFITVEDKNFDKNAVVLNCSKGSEEVVCGEWKSDENKFKHTCTVELDKEGLYNFTFSCADMAGNVSEKKESGQFIIDKAAPDIKVSFEDGDTNENKNYKERTAIIRITEKNFDEKLVKVFDISNGSENALQTSIWTQEGDIHTATVNFTQEGIYDFIVTCEDVAGNKEREMFQSGEFVIDTTKPEVIIDYRNNGDSYNEYEGNKYYNKSRTLLITVKDKNFNAKSAAFEMWENSISVKCGEWKPSEDKLSYTCEIPLEQDGLYHFSFSCSDMAGNSTSKMDCGNFIIDKTKPEIAVTYGGEEAKNGKYYKQRSVKIEITEKNFNFRNVVFTPANGTAQLPAIENWSLVGDKHTATVIFSQDGIYGFTITCTDIAGNSAESSYNVEEFIIDTTNPEVKIEYDKESPVNGKYFNTFRTAKVIVTDNNFDDTCVTKFDITSDSDKPKIGKWTKGKSDDSGSSQYVCEVLFEADDEYSFKFSCEDLAGNKSDTEDGGSFIIDTTRPEISVAYDNNNARNGKYYNNTRTATITIADKSFSDDLVKIEPLNASGVDRLPAISSWTADGEKHTVRINFTEDGSYGFRITCSDLADNSAKEYLSEVFIIDRASPEITFGGVKNNSANNGAAAPTLKCTDSYLDETSTQIILTGTNHGELTGTAQKSAVKDGFQLVYPDFEHTQEMDDFYTLKVRAVDLAGNETEDELNFSVNRFGSTYRISVDTQRLVNEYYTGKAPTITVTEINIDELEYGEVTISKDGQTVTLTQGSNYAVTKEGDDEDWKSYTYSIKPGNFAKDGVYSVGFYSKDKASNTSDNRIKGKEIEFALDTTAPSIVADGIESDRNYNEKSRDVTVDVKDNMYLTNLSVTDNGETILDMSEKELADNGGLVTFVLDEDDTQRDIVITAMDKVNNMQKLEYHDVLITSKTEVIKEVETSKPVTDSGEDILKPAISAGFGIPSYDEDNSLLYMVTEVMSAAVLITAVVVFYRKRRKRM